VPTGDEVEVAITAEDELGPAGVRVAGLRNVRIYAAEDGAPPQVVGQVGAAGTATIRLAAGHTYALYSVAVDRAGHEEAAPPGPDAPFKVDA
jgi:hypothetical protein